jgi:hypothetical protein
MKKLCRANTLEKEDRTAEAPHPPDVVFVAVDHVARPQRFLVPDPNWPLRQSFGVNILWHEAREVSEPLELRLAYGTRTKRLNRFLVGGQIPG